MRVKVTFSFEPDDNEADGSHETGLTEQGFEELTNDLMALGAEDIQVERE